MTHILCVIKILENYRFWAGETCFEDFDGLESRDLDRPLRTDSDFLKKNFKIFKIFSMINERRPSSFCGACENPIGESKSYF